MKQRFGIDSDTGGVILIDPSLMANFDGDFPSCLNVVFDPMGQTCAVEDYPDEDWTEVWQSAAAHLQAIPGGDGLCVVLSASGLNFIGLQDEPLTPDEQAQVLETLTGSIRVSNGQLAVIDGMHFFDEPGDDDPRAGGDVESCYQIEVFPIADGIYNIDIHHLNWHGSSETVGVFGTEDHPAFIIVLKASTTSPEAATTPNVAVFDTSMWNTQPKAGLYCNAVCTEVKLQSVSADLYLTSQLSSGKVRFAKPLTMLLKRGQPVLVHLKEDNGSYWTADLAID